TNESDIDVPSISAASTKASVFILPNVDNLSDVVIYSFFASQSNNPQLDNEDLKQINVDDLEEMDLKWQMAILTMRAKRVGSYDWSFQADEEPINYALMAFTSSSLSSSSGSKNEAAPCSKACSKAYATLQSHYDKLTIDFRKSQFDVLSYKSSLESVEARLVVYQQNENMFKEDIKLLKLDVMLRDNALVELRKKFEKAEQERDNFESDDSVPTSPMNDRYKSSEGYHAVPHPYTGTFMPPKPNLVFHDAPTASKTIPNVFHVNPSTTKPNKDMSQTYVQPVEHPTQAKNLKKDIPKSRGHKHSLNRKACFVCKSLNHLIKDYDFYEKHMVLKPIRNHEMRVTHQNSARMTHPYSNKHVVPTTILTRSRLVPLNAARPVTTVVPQTTVNNQRPAKHVVNKPHSPIKRTINHRPTPKTSNFHQKVTTVKTKKVNVVQGTMGNWVWKPKCTVLDHVSRLTSASMTLKQFDYTDALGRSKSVMAWVPKRH
nr:hypothetical protein [Tanacetum cinerariifolium]